MNMKLVALAVGFATMLLAVGAEDASAYDCRDEDDRVVQAIEDASARANDSSAPANMIYCAHINVTRAMIWKVLQCLEYDPNLSSEHQNLLREQLDLYRHTLKQGKEGFRALSSASASCDCWSSICAE